MYIIRKGQTRSGFIWGKEQERKSGNAKINLEREESLVSELILISRFSDV